MSNLHGWERWNDWYREQWRPVMDWMVRAVRPEPGMTALDVACGTGQPAFLVAEQVGPSGRVIAVDVDDEMLAAAARLARAAGLGNVELRHLDMHALDGIADGSVDAVTCGSALMFSPGPVGAMREARRVLRAGRHVALCVWGDPAANPFLTTALGATAAVIPPAPRDPRAPGPFRLAAPGELDGVLREAGFRDVRVEPVPIVLESRSLDAHWEMLLDLAPWLRKAVVAASVDDGARIHDALFTALAPYVFDGRVRVPATLLAATATA